MRLMSGPAYLICCNTYTFFATEVTEITESGANYNVGIHFRHVVLCVLCDLCGDLFIAWPLVFAMRCSFSLVRRGSTRASCASRMGVLLTSEQKLLPRRVPKPLIVAAPF